MTGIRVTSCGGDLCVVNSARQGEGTLDFDRSLSSIAALTSEKVMDLGNFLSFFIDSAEIVGCGGGGRGQQPKPTEILYKMS